MIFILPFSEIKNFVSYLAIIKNNIDNLPASESAELIRHLASAFVINVMLLLQKYQPDNIEYAGPASKASYLIMDGFFELLAKYHTKERRLSFYADKMCITTKYLSTKIKSMSGKKATDWIGEFVVMEAKSLLKYSGQDIQQVAQQLNFPSQSAFGKYFKSETGLSPKEFIESCQGYEETSHL